MIAVTKAVNAAPITMPTDRSITLPRMMNSLKPRTVFSTVHSIRGFRVRGHRPEVATIEGVGRRCPDETRLTMCVPR